MKKDYSTVIIGLILVLVGIAFLGNVFSWWNFSIFFDGWWTMFIIIPSLISLFEKFKFSKLIPLGIGILFLLWCWDIISFTLLSQLAIPVVVICVGLYLIFGNKLSPELKTKFRKIENSNGAPLAFDCIFGNTSPIINGSPKHLAFTTILGNTDATLCDIEIEEDVLIKTTAIFGTIKLEVPKNVNILTTHTNLFGEVTNNTSNETTENSPTIYIVSTNIFGEIKIK